MVKFEIGTSAFKKQTYFIPIPNDRKSLKFSAKEKKKRLKTDEKHELNRFESKLEFSGGAYSAHPTNDGFK